MDARSRIAAPLVEIFASYQGEGPWAGAPHLFVRFGGCNLRCAYCDTPEGLAAPPLYRVETAPFRGAFVRRPNPCTVDACAAHLGRLARAGVPFHALALTGGEPLLHADFLAALLPRVRRWVPRVYLDTNATLPRALARVAAWVDIVSVGLKLPSCPGAGAAWREAAAFLRIASAGGRSAFLKVVVTRESTVREVARAAAMAAAVRRGMTMVLQPVTPRPGGPRPPGAGRIRALLAAAAARLGDVRVLPQLHPRLGWK